jgi:fructosamine-3-kinase
MHNGGHESGSNMREDVSVAELLLTDTASVHKKHNVITELLHKSYRLSAARSNFFSCVDTPKAQLAFIATYNVLSRGRAVKASHTASHMTAEIEVTLTSNPCELDCNPTGCCDQI